MDLNPPAIALLIGVAIVAFILGRTTKSRRPDDLVSAQMAARVPGTPRPSANGDEVAALLAEGKKIQAIKLYRELTGVGLKEAKDAVEAMAAGREPFAQVPFAGRPPAHDVAAQAAELKARGQIIPAIKLVREKTGLGLKEAKDFVDRL
ncbi:ribosomal protein L7/L12 [Hamadaea flava]|uniref:Ribosomal protein L7/L12 n=1 Tax=Hamadaea flava TaxID=1742688 RepID=A0ABV8LSA0_9ACTN|nr:ribosomal protein L7/L12 [Hamadaea flava]MCP2327275.1 ribosomal protein L7/L12 [Hamadaea flava]